MKKFLTVLLALSVVFTYTVGTAFAAATDTEIKDASDYAEQRLTAVANGYKADLLAEKKYDSVAIDKANADAAVVGRQVANDLITMYKDHENFANAFRTNFNAWATADPKASGITIETFDYAKGTYYKYFESVIKGYDYEAQVAKAVKLVTAVDTSVYADSVYTVTEDEKQVDYTYKTYAERLQKDTIADLQDTSKVTQDNYVAKIKELLYGTGDAENIVKSQGFFGKLKDLKTAEEVAEDDARSEANIAYAKSILAYTGKISYFDTVKKAEGDSVAATNGKFMGVAIANPAKITKAEATAINAAIMKEIDKALEVANVYYEKESANPVAEAQGVTTTTFKTGVMDKADAAVDVYEKYVAIADERKADLLFDGTKMYDDAAIDAALAKDKTELYAKAFTRPYTVESFRAESALLKVAPVTDPVANAIVAATEKFQSTINYSGDDKTPEADRKYCEAFYANEAKADYRDIAVAAIDALDDAKTIDEVNAIMADADKKLGELRTAEQANALKLSDVQKYENALVEFLDEQEELMGSDYRPASFTDIEKIYNGTTTEAGKFDTAKDAADLAALYAEAKNEVSKIMKDAELTAEAEKVSTLVAALPATVDSKLSTEKQFMDAKDAYEAFVELYGANPNEIKGLPYFMIKLNTLKDAQQNAVSAAATALTELKPYTVADKEAVEAVRNQYETYKAYYKQYDETFTATLTELVEAEAKIKLAEIDEVKTMIQKLTNNSTLEEIKAAADAYDALTGSQQRAVKAALGEAFLYKLEIMQNAQIKSVEALKITASSVAGKGYIKVKWTVKGDASDAKYQIYRSVKKNSGFGTKPIFTTANKTYKNTKSLKKGTRYYYKVRAFVELNGQKYYSDWSNKAYRVAK